MPDPDLCPGYPCAVVGPHLAHGMYLSADQVARVWRPGPRLPSAQYTITLAVTGDDIGMDALGAVIPPILTSNLGMPSVHVTEIRPGYPAEPQISAARPTPTVRVHTGYARTVNVYLDGTELATGNYDEHGWSGLSMIGQLATTIAEAAGLTVVTCDGDSHGHCDDGGHDV